ncbi:MAG: ThuA domain-containing protein [Halioglobus sp.]|nr:ThuA domain-containing protein [Halioglobus sp.]
MLPRVATLLIDWRRALARSARQRALRGWLACVGLGLVLPLASCTAPATRWDDGSVQVLVFSKTLGYRHASIGAGRRALQALARDAGYDLHLTEDAGVFNDEALAQFAAVVFLNTTGDVLDAAQQAAFERYIRAGGGFVGVHSASDTEYDWPWFGELVGARFDGHPEIQPARLRVVDNDHPATRTLPDPWRRTDEWYNFRDIVPDLNWLITIDESSYTGGTNGEAHPMAWYRHFDGGRSFYTAMGHTAASYREDTFLEHLRGGLAWAIGEGGAAQVMPDEDRFAREVLDENLDEPMELDEVPGRGILFIERRGAVKFHDFASGATRLAGQLEVFYGNEDGLLGLAVDPDHARNHFIYLFYTAPLEESLQRVSRFVLRDGVLDLASEHVLLQIPSDRFCCHSGGGLEFGPDGSLYIGVGDNTNPFESDGFAPIDERPGREIWDAQRSAANSMDLRGKILRIRPEADGSYTIPDGNLFAPGTPDTRPEIYIMGCRNPFRFAIDSASGDLIWGDVGPDAGKDDTSRGPRGMGEFNRARQAGFWGWPYTRGNNLAYVDYDFAAERSLDSFDPASPVNDSPNNSGIRELPPAQPSFVWYSYGTEERFPWLGSGGVNPMAGPVFHRRDFPAEATTFPPYFEGAILLYEWMRDWIVVAHFDRPGQRLRRVEPFMPKEHFSHPMDMIFGSDGSLYLLEYGQKWNQRNPDARLNRISYIADGTAGSKPVVAKRASAGGPRGQQLVEGSDCGACHGIEQLVNGPSYKQISERYDADAMDYLVSRIIDGGSGVWGERHMSAHPDLSREDAAAMVSWILSLGAAKAPTGHQRPDATRNR